MTLQDQITEVQREIGLRRLVYPKFVARGQMTEGQATYHLAVMEAVLGTLTQMAGEAEQQELFGGREEG